MALTPIKPPSAIGAPKEYEIVITARYAKRLIQFLKKHPAMKAQYFKAMELMQANPFHPSLRLHALSGKHQGLHSVSINLSYRMTLELLIVDRQITPVDVGDHDTVY